MISIKTFRGGLSEKKVNLIVEGSEQEPPTGPVPLNQRMSTNFPLRANYLYHPEIKETYWYMKPLSAVELPFIRVSCTGSTCPIHPGVSRDCREKLWNKVILCDNACFEVWVRAELSVYKMSPVQEPPCFTPPGFKTCNPPFHQCLNSVTTFLSRQGEIEQQQIFSNHHALRHTNVNLVWWIILNVADWVAAEHWAGSHSLSQALIWCVFSQIYPQSLYVYENSILWLMSSLIGLDIV